VTDAGAELAAIVGATHVQGGAAAAAFAIDGRAPRWVVAPGAVEEVSRCLALAAARGLAVAPTGRGTRLGWGGAPHALDLVLSLRRLDRIVAHEAADLTISVEAGVTLGAIGAHLAPHRQLLPLDPPRAAGATVGGVIATAASGPYRARYGTIRDLLLGVTVARADGALVKGGGRVVKNATGYDMPKLHVGALGTLGVILAAHLRLHPRPAEEASWLFAFDSPEAALEAALGIMDAPVVVSRLQLLDAPTLAWLGHAAAASAALAVTVGSVPEGVRAQGARIAEICRGGGARAEAVDAPDGWWARVSEAASPAVASCLTLRVGARPTDVVKALHAAEAAGRGTAAVRATMEVANGVLHLNLTGPGLADAAALLARVREELARLGATCVVEHAPPEVKPALDVWGDVGPALEPMRRLKAEMDPKGILNPGRYVGGI
jgi:glycolate oxidase FAD binding subunit